MESSFKSTSILLIKGLSVGIAVKALGALLWYTKSSLGLPHILFFLWCHRSGKNLSDCHLFYCQQLNMDLVSSKFSVGWSALITITLYFSPIMTTMSTLLLEAKNNGLACDPRIKSVLLKSGSLICQQCLLPSYRRPSPQHFSLMLGSHFILKP